MTVAALAHPPQPNVLLLDTNMLVIYARAGEASRRLEAQLNLQGGQVQGIVSVITVCEALAFAMKNNWGQHRRDVLMDLIRTRLVSVDVNRPEILTAYAEIDHHCEKIARPARPMGQNDTWIAATANVLNCVLVTTDKDFDHLHGVKLHRRWIDPASLMASP